MDIGEKKKILKRQGILEILSDIASGKIEPTKDQLRALEMLYKIEYESTDDGIDLMPLLQAIQDS